MLDWTPIKHQPQLDIVGIVAILGEGSTTRNAQTSALGWHHILPRLLPAPQALLVHEHKKRLPAVPGTVVGVFSGNIRFEHNFFCQLLHKDDLDRHEVELVKVWRREDTDADTFFARLKRQMHKRRPAGRHDESTSAGRQAYDVKKFSSLAFLSVLGCSMSSGMIVASIWLHDGPALLATVCLSVTSSNVGFASWWQLKYEEDVPSNLATPRRERAETIPDSDVVIFYPRQGAFRVVRCSETISRLYFRTETCQHFVGDNGYRALALLASVFLMVGLLSMSNAQFSMQAAFVLCYIVLNALYWGFSALNPTGEWGHWKHKYDYKKIKVKVPSSGTKETTQHRFRKNHAMKLLRDSRKINTWSSPSTTIRSPVQVSPTADDLAFESPEMRQRKVAFSRADTVSRTEKSLELKLDESSAVHRSVVSAQLSRPSRRQTADLEGGRKRLLVPFGSVRDAVVRCLGGKNDDCAHRESGQFKVEDDIPRKLSKIRSWLSRNRIINKIESSENAAPQATFTTALWKVIALTGNGRWLRQTHIAPNNEVWSKWIDAASSVARPKQNINGQWISACTISYDGYIELPVWNYQQRLKELFDGQNILDKRRPPEAREFRQVVLMMDAIDAAARGMTLRVNIELRIWARRARARVEARRQRPSGPATPLTSQKM